MNSTALFESLGPISKTCVEPLSLLVATRHRVIVVVVVCRDIPKYKEKKIIEIIENKFSFV